MATAPLWYVPGKLQLMNCLPQTTSQSLRSTEKQIRTTWEQLKGDVTNSESVSLMDVLEKEKDHHKLIHRN